MASHRVKDYDGSKDDGGVGLIIPQRPGLCIICAGIGIGKTTLLCSIAAAHTHLGQHIIYIIGEGHERDIQGQLQAVGAHAARVDLVDCVVSYPDVLLANMLDHRAIAPRLARAEVVIVDPLATFESDGIRKFCIRQRLAPFHRLAQREQHPVTSYFALHTNKSRATIREALDLVPGAWAGNVETCWQIEPTDKLGHAVLEMTRGRDHPRPWPAYA